MNVGHGNEMARISLGYPVLHLFDNIRHLDRMDIHTQGPEMRGLPFYLNRGAQGRVRNFKPLGLSGEREFFHRVLSAASDRSLFSGCCVLQEINDPEI